MVSLNNTKEVIQVSHTPSLIIISICVLALITSCVGIGNQDLMQGLGLESTQDSQYSAESTPTPESASESIPQSPQEPTSESTSEPTPNATTEPTSELTSDPTPELPPHVPELNIDYIVIKGVEYSTSLTELFLSGPDLRDESINPSYADYILCDEDIITLQYMTNLKELHFTDCDVTDWTPISGLTNLTTLTMYQCNASDTTFLANLTNLTRLSIFNSFVDDIAPLSGLTNLRILSLVINQITDISPLAGLADLEELWLGGNQIIEIGRAHV